jgi:hypothetical protein
MKSFHVLLLLTGFSLHCFNAAAQADYIDEETSAPYGFMDMEFYANYIRYEGYSISNINVTKGVASGYGGGLEGHFPFVYLLAHKNEHRFRIADDIVLGFSVTPGVGVSVNYGLGIQTVYRINEAFDIGAKYYPIYFRGDKNTNMGHTYGSAYALHARIERFYVDYRIIPEVINAHLESTGINLLSLKYLYTPITSNKSYCLSVAFGWANYKQAGYSASPIVQQEFNSKTFKWNTVKLGWGIYF